MGTDASVPIPRMPFVPEFPTDASVPIIPAHLNFAPLDAHLQSDPFLGGAQHAFNFCQAAVMAWLLYNACGCVSHVYFGRLRAGSAGSTTARDGYTYGNSSGSNNSC